MSVDFLVKSSKLLNTLKKSKDFLVINKPAGLLVHPHRYSQEKTLLDFLLKFYPDLKNLGPKKRFGIVHRLDKDVSGLLVIARTETMYYYLIQQFKEKKVIKRYIGLTYNHPPLKKGLINLPIGRTKKGKIVAIKFKKDIKDEKEALTEYKVEKKFFQPQKFSLLEVCPLTGRTNQIRVHLRSLNCPVVGDKKYGKRDLFLKKSLEIKRIFLYAYYLGFYNLNNKYLEFKISLPIELRKFLKKIK